MTGSTTTLNLNNENEDAQAARIVLAHSVSAGELLTEENLKSVVLPHYNGFGGFFDLTHVLGRKTKTPLREGTVLLSRHLLQIGQFRLNNRLILKIRYLA